MWRLGPTIARCATYPRAHLSLIIVMDMYTGHRRLSGALAGEGRTSSARRTSKGDLSRRRRRKQRSASRLGRAAELARHRLVRDPLGVDELAGAVRVEVLLHAHPAWKSTSESGAPSSRRDVALLDSYVRHIAIAPPCARRASAEDWLAHNPLVAQVLRTR